jgi:hypothetical protein
MVVRIYVFVSGGRAMPVPTELTIKLSFRKSQGVTEESGGWGESEQKHLRQQPETPS